MDPHAAFNERLSGERRHGSHPDPYEPLMRAVADEVGGLAEAVASVVVTRGQIVGLKVAGLIAGREGAARRIPVARLVTTANRLSSGVPDAAGKLVSRSSFWAMRTGFHGLRALRRFVERAR